jgi:hypothetical protein
VDQRRGVRDSQASTLKTLINGVHISESERAIKKVRIESQIIGQLFRLRAFEETMRTAPSHKLTIESKSLKGIELKSSIGKVTIGIHGSYSPAWNRLAPRLSAKCYLDVEPHANFAPLEAIRIITQLEYLFSVLTFDIVRATGSHLTISCPDNLGNLSERDYQVQRAKINKRAKTKLEQHEFPFHLTEVDFSQLLDRFLTIFDKVEQSLHWYRIVTAENRYLEDKFFYSVRMIEALYKALRIKVSTDETAIGIIDGIISTLGKSSENEAYVEFLKKRALPIFLGSSLSNILDDIQRKYADLPIVKILDPKTISRLRGKEAHGSIRSSNAAEYQFMAYGYETLRILYAALLLESCGLDRAFLINRLKSSLRFQGFLGEGMLKTARENIEAQPALTRS